MTDSKVDELVEYLLRNKVTKLTMEKKLGKLYMQGVNDAMDSFWDGLTDGCKKRYEKYLETQHNIVIKRI